MRIAHYQVVWEGPLPAGVEKRGVGKSGVPVGVENADWLAGTGGPGGALVAGAEPRLLEGVVGAKEEGVKGRKEKANAMAAAGEVGDEPARARAHPQERKRSSVEPKKKEKRKKDKDKDKAQMMITA